VQEGEEGKGTKGSKRVVGKVVGDECVFIWFRAGLADEVTSDAAGGEGGHGVAKADRVIHRYTALPHPIAKRGLARDRRKSNTANCSTAICG
jgi:hypothetical protein